MTSGFFLRRRISSTVFKESLEYLQSQHASVNVSKEKLATEAIDKFQLAMLLESNIHKKTTRFPIPKLFQMNNSQWKHALGPNLARQLAKEYRLLDDILPYETEATINLSLKFGINTARLGNLLTPDKTISEPSLSFEPQSKDCFYSFVLFDADYPDEGKSTFIQFALWSRLNIKPEGKVVFGPSTDLGIEALSYIPPHPQRGSGTHRLVAALIEHEQRATIDSFDRQFDMKQLVKSLNGHIAGFAFFRSCWTKAVSLVYREAFKQSEPLFGELKEPIPIRPYKYENA